MKTPAMTRRAMIAGAAFSGGLTAFQPSAAKAPSRPARLAHKGSLTTPNEAMVSTRTGRVRGFRRDGITIFRGIPYGADPSGNARFKPASPPEPWSGVRSSLSYGPVCPQPKRGWGDDELAFIADWNDGHPDENCLTLNIWTNEPRQGASKPVIVWLHGGGFTTGSSYELPGYEGSRLAAKDVVVVSLNHRLGVFGFLDLSGFSAAEYAKSGNAGMLDIVLALQWVRDNIRAFGGDPERVTIAGQSGGGAKVSALMAMKVARGLFHRAVVMSGSIAPAQSPATARSYADALFDELKIAPGDVGALLRTSTDALLAAGTRATERFAVPGQIPGLGRGRIRLRGSWSPVGDGAVLPGGAWEDSAPEGARDIPLLVGNVRDEFKISSMVFDHGRLEGFSHMIWGAGAPHVLEAIDKEFPTYSDNGKAGLLSGVQFHNAAVDQALLKARQGGAPTFAYWFTYNPRGLLDGRIGAPHCSDIPYFFDNAPLAAQQTGNSPEANRLADLMSETLVRFAATGNPSTPKLHWPQFTEATRETMVFDLESRALPYPGRRLFEAARAAE